MFTHNIHEGIPKGLRSFFKNSGDLKIDLWNAFVDSDLIGICDDDCSVLPRIIPASYLPVIKRSCSDIMLFLMRFLSLPAKELLSILPSSPVADYLINEFGLIKHRPERIIGSIRFDMATVGKLIPKNPPKLFEVNEIGFDGTGRSSLILEILLRIIPDLKKHVICFDTANSEVKNMLRLGKNFVRFHYDSYNWEEETILAKAKAYGLNLKLVSPKVFKVKPDEIYTRLTKEPVILKNGALQVGGDRYRPDAFQVAYSFELKDYKEAPQFFADLIRSKTPQYSPFYTSLVATKSILTVLSDHSLVKKLVGPDIAKRLKGSIIPAHLLEGHEEETRKNASKLVCKYADGMGGEHVYIGNKIRGQLKEIPDEEKRHWIIQERIHLNTIKVHGILSRPRRVIADLGVYIHYDWNGKSFTNLAIGGFITRATNRSQKVNVSGGGIQVPVMFDKTI